MRQRLDLVSANVEIGARGETAYLAHHIVDEGVRAFLVDAEATPADIGSGIKPGRPAAAGEVRIRDHRGIDVTGHVDLGYDEDVSRGSVADDVLVILLRIKAARPAADLRQRSELGKAWT